MLEALAMYGIEWNSPFIVPVAGCLMILGIVLGGVWSGVRNREIQSRERLEAIARGVPIPPTPEELAITHGRPTSDLRRRRANIRLAGVVLLASAVGLILFFMRSGGGSAGAGRALRSGGRVDSAGDWSGIPDRHEDPDARDG